VYEKHLAVALPDYVVGHCDAIVGHARKVALCRRERAQNVHEYRRVAVQARTLAAVG
jgi:hypothetical protein